uniref:DNA mismatch repair proteins mutS family domain-containing protein n=1 Tax=Amphora coffeiformis TaxID=265554 RepID=A0A7S3L9I9_9STRA
MARETCVASLDAGSPTTMQVTKQGNGQTYAETLAYLEVLQPDEVLLNEGRKSSQLARKIMELYNHPTLAFEHTGEWEEECGEELNHNMQECQPRTVVKFISRGCFDQTRGSEVLRRVARAETYDASVIEEYILLSSAHAVIVYTQQSLGANFANGSVFLSVSSGGNNRMAIDRSTLLQLELLVNSKSGKTKHSLIGTIDKTKTVVGGRLLRTNLMMPPTQVDTINSRLDLVDLFLSSEDFFYAVLEHLSRLPDVDKMLSNVALIPKAKPQNMEQDESVNVRMAAKGIAALVGIKSALSAMPALASVLEGQLASSTPAKEQASPDGGMQEETTVRTDRTSLLIGLGGGGQSASSGKLEANHLLRAIACTLRQPQLNEILQAVSDIFTPSTEFSRNANAMRHQECFALKAGEGGIMELLRRNYLANVDDIYKKADEYAELYGFHVVVKYTTLRGHFLAIPAGASVDLPVVFIQPTKAGRYIHCTTEHITSLNTRAKDNVRDLLLLTYSSIQEVLDFARERYDALAALCDAIALLDMCHSFADTISISSQSWCRPIVVDPDAPVEEQQDGISDELTKSMIIRQGQFGIEVPPSGTGLTEEFIANDTYVAKETRFTLITGINGSGKSTYLKQLAIIVVLAHCGCYVPAEQASIPLRDRICARIGNTDDQENNISTFMLEMKETAFICNNAGHRSLILIDELGRATSNEDGVALAWSVAEFLLKTRAITFFVTHFSKLNELADIYPYAQNTHLESFLSAETREIKYTHRIQPGACRVPTDYGVSLANACGWPQMVVDRARILEGQARSQLKTDNLSAHMLEAKKSRMQAQQVVERTIKSLKGYVAVENAGSFDLLRRELGALHKQATPTEDEELCRVIHSVLSPPGLKPMGTPNGDDNGTSSISSSSSEESQSDSSSSGSE